MCNGRATGGFAWIGYLCLAMGLAVAVLCPLLAQHLQRRLVKFVEVACDRDQSPRTYSSSTKASANVVRDDLTYLSTYRARTAEMNASFARVYSARSFG